MRGQEDGYGLWMPVLRTCEHVYAALFAGRANNGRTAFRKWESQE